MALTRVHSRRKTPRRRNCSTTRQLMALVMILISAAVLTYSMIEYSNASIDLRASKVVQVALVASRTSSTSGTRSNASIKLRTRVSHSVTDVKLSTGNVTASDAPTQGLARLQTRASSTSWVLVASDCLLDLAVSCKVGQQPLLNGLVKVTVEKGSELIAQAGRRSGQDCQRLCDANASDALFAQVHTGAKLPLPLPLPLSLVWPSSALGYLRAHYVPYATHIQQAQEPVGATRNANSPSEENRRGRK